jgi:hypothetical protein
VQYYCRNETRWANNQQIELQDTTATLVKNLPNNYKNNETTTQLLKAVTFTTSPNKQISKLTQPNLRSRPSDKNHTHQLNRPQIL